MPKDKPADPPADSITPEARTAAVADAAAQADAAVAAAEAAAAAAAAPPAPAPVVTGKDGWETIHQTVDGQDVTGYRCPSCKQVKWSQPAGPCDHVS